MKSNKICISHIVCEGCDFWAPFYDETGIDGQHNEYIAEEYCMFGGKHDIEFYNDDGDYVSNCPKL